MTALEARGRRIAEVARRRTVARLAVRLRLEVPGRRVEEGEEGVTVTGRGVLRDPRLVWIGSLLR